MKVAKSEGSVSKTGRPVKPVKWNELKDEQWVPPVVNVRGLRVFQVPKPCLCCGCDVHPCGVTFVPDVDDADAWAAIQTLHAPDCTWAQAVRKHYKKIKEHRHESR